MSKTYTYILPIKEIKMNQNDVDWVYSIFNVIKKTMGSVLPYKKGCQISHLYM